MAYQDSGAGRYPTARDNAFSRAPRRQGDPRRATPPQGPWRHACGHSGEDVRRTLIRLCAKFVEGLIQVHGRLWRTLPSLLFNLGKPTQDLREGHRAPQIPPLRLFLVGRLTGGSKIVHIDIPTSFDANGKVSA